MVMSYKNRRALSIAIPLFTGLLFWGAIPAFFGIDATTNIANTGVSLGFVFGLLNIFMAWMVWKHRVP